MDILKMLSELRAERDQIVEAIAALEALSLGGKKKRGRPPKSFAEAIPAGEEPVARKTYVRSAKTRAKMAAAQKRRWEAAAAQTPEPQP